MEKKLGVSSKVNLPYKALSSNATNIENDGTTLTWDFMKFKEDTEIKKEIEFLKKDMSALKHLNLKEVKVKDVLLYDKSVETEKNHWEWLSRRMDNAIPKEAFYQNKNIPGISFSGNWYGP